MSATLRVFNADGGGERGYIICLLIKKVISLLGIESKDFYKLFPIMSGTSIGGIITLALAYGIPVETLLNVLKTQGAYIFSLSSLTPSLRPNSITKAGLLAADTPFYQSSGITENSYGIGLLKTILQNFFGSSTLKDLKTKVIIPAYEDDTNTYKLLSNIDLPEFIGQNELIVNVALATSAAPAYFPPFKMNGHTYLDGGIAINNPSSLAVETGKFLLPSYEKICLLSLGTGLGVTGFNDDLNTLKSILTDTSINSFTEGNLKAFNTISTLFKLFEIAMTGSQEIVAKAFSIQDKYSTDEFYNLRFQGKLDKTLNTELDNTDAAILIYYETFVDDLWDQNINNINTFFSHFKLGLNI